MIKGRVEVQFVDQRRFVCVPEVVMKMKKEMKQRQKQKQREALNKREEKVNEFTITGEQRKGLLRHFSLFLLLFVDF